VCSQVFDHTSVLQFLEKFLSHKTKKQVEEPNISAWRRVVCGDLTSAFKPYLGEKIDLPAFISKNNFIQGVHKAKFKENPSGFRPLTSAEIQQINDKPSTSPLMPRQEKGIRQSCGLPYELYVDGKIADDKKSFGLTFEASRQIFGSKAAGSPFNVYAPGKFKSGDSFEPVKTWAYAVAPGDRISDKWDIGNFEDSRYHLRVYGPNGFYREFAGNSVDPELEIKCRYGKVKKSTTATLEIHITNLGVKDYAIEIKDEAYDQSSQKKRIEPKGQLTIKLDLAKSFGWYDFALKVAGSAVFERRYAGRVETGESTFTDPAMA